MNDILELHFDVHITKKQSNTYVSATVDPEQIMSDCYFMQRTYSIER